MTIRRLNDSAIHKLRASFISTIAQCVVELVQNSKNLYLYNKRRVLFYGLLQFVNTKFVLGLDALATTIEIHVDMKKFFVQITDNGAGITPDDMGEIGQRYGVLNLLLIVRFL